MERHFISEIEDVKRKLTIMGGHVEEALREATEALLQRDPQRFKKVHEVEQLINKDQILVDSACLELLAKQAPVASDLRFVISVIKINTDLERMGDQCVNIAYNGLDYIKYEPVSVCPHLPQMAAQVKTMVKESLDAFVRGDSELANRVLTMDDQIDQWKNDAFHQILDFMETNPTKIRPAMNLLLIARNLERLADHSTNIAEDVIYAHTGKDIRHKSLTR